MDIERLQQEGESNMLLNEDITRTQPEIIIQDEQEEQKQQSVLSFQTKQEYNNIVNEFIQEQRQILGQQICTQGAQFLNGKCCDQGCINGKFILEKFLQKLQQDYDFHPKQIPSDQRTLQALETSKIQTTNSGPNKQLRPYKFTEPLMIIPKMGLPPLDPRGIKNIGNTCFINTALQVLVNILVSFEKEFQIHFEKRRILQKQDEDFIDLLQQLKLELREEIMQENCYKKEEIAQIILKKLNLKRGTQYDSLSALMRIINSMSQEIKSQKQDFILEDYFLVERQSLLSFQDQSKAIQELESQQNPQRLNLFRFLASSSTCLYNDALSSSNIFLEVMMTKNLNNLNDIHLEELLSENCLHRQLQSGFQSQIAMECQKLPQILIIKMSFQDKNINLPFILQGRCLTTKQDEEYKSYCLNSIVIMRNHGLIRHNEAIVEHKGFLFQINDNAVKILTEGDHAIEVSSEGHIVVADPYYVTYVLNKQFRSDLK